MCGSTAATTAKRGSLVGHRSGKMINDEDFIDRFWIAYWQGRELVRRAFPPDGWPEQPAYTWLPGDDVSSQ